MLEGSDTPHLELKKFAFGVLLRDFSNQVNAALSDYHTTLKLTLLYHRALKTPRLPMPLYVMERVAGLRLQGIYPSSLSKGDQQFWL